MSNDEERETSSSAPNGNLQGLINSLTSPCRDADKRVAALEKERHKERDQQSRIHGAILTKHKTHRRPKVTKHCLD